MLWRYGSFNLKLSTGVLTGDTSVTLPVTSGKLITEELASKVYVRSVPDSGVSTFLYTSDGKLSSIVATNGDSTTFSYDLSGRLVNSVAVISNMSRTKTYSYDLSGSLSSIAIE